MCINAVGALSVSSQEYTFQPYTLFTVEDRQAYKAEVPRDVTPTFLLPIPLILPLLPAVGLTAPSGYAILTMLQVIRAVVIYHGSGN